MVSLSVSQLSLLLFFVLSFYGNTIVATTDISTRGSWKPILDDGFLVSASTPDQRSQNQTCFPKSWNVLMEHKMIIATNNKCSSVEVLQCYCLTYDYKSSDMDNGSVRNMNCGKCLYGCFIQNTYYQVEQSNKGIICALFNRKGILCGQCKDGHGPAAYSFRLTCVECGNSTHWTRVPLYILIAYGPLTVFLGVIVMFTVSVNSAPLHGWILVCQLLTSNIFMRALTLANSPKYPNNIFTIVAYIMESTYGIWNLDFFRSVYTPFCLHPNLTTLQVMSLDYIIAAYPLVLIVVMYLLVQMYSRNCRPVVVVLRPFHYCFTRFRHQLNIRTSLVDAFGTFFSLSYVKFLNTTFDLLAPTRVWDFNGSSYRVYYDGTMEMFKGRHIPYAVLAVLVGLICNILPLVLILCYSFRRTHVLLNCLPLSVRTILFPFMDNILACYKDGTNGTRNCRYFGVVYHIAFMGILSGFVLTKSTLVFGVNAFMCIVIGMLVAVIQPYKAKVYNIVDTVLILSIGLGFDAGMSVLIAKDVDPQNKSIADVIAGIPLFIPLFYFIGFLGLKIRKRFVQSLRCTFIKVKASLSRGRRRTSEMDIMSEDTDLD